MPEATHQAIEQVVREAYGRLLAFLAARWRDLSAAEDALADALQAALETWPRTGIPRKPEAWLLTVARRRLIDALRRASVEDAALPQLFELAEAAQEQPQSEEPVFPDERLKLLFICAHPAIDASVRTPLMLQVVLGLDAARIASAFLIKPSAMGQRLSRAKAKIRNAGMAFEVPETEELPARLAGVLETIYAAYGRGWDDVLGADARTKNLAQEAIGLGRLLLQHMPAEPEVQGLLALMLYCEARRDARRDGAGHYVPLSQQDVSRWSAPLLTEAEALLSKAAQSGSYGHYQLEAAIQSVHAARQNSGFTDWEAIALLYEGLVRLAPTLGALISRAAAVAEARGAAAGWLFLKDLPLEAVQTYQPYWALSAHLLQEMGQAPQAQAAYNQAIALCEDESMRRFLLEQAARKNGQS